MAPIYESDVAEKRWLTSEWKHYEFWERVEHRIKRNQRLWIVSAVLVFLGISSVPVVMDQRPRWAALSSARLLAQEINRIKREAGLEHMALRIRFKGNGSLDFVVEKSENCSTSTSIQVREGSLASQSEGSLVLLERSTGEQMGIPGMVGEFCYDPMQGSEFALQGQAQVGFGMVPLSDLAVGRHDRLSVVLISGSTGEVSFD